MNEQNQELTPHMQNYRRSPLGLNNSIKLEKCMVALLFTTLNHLGEKIEIESYPSIIEEIWTSR